MSALIIFDGDEEILTTVEEIELEKGIHKLILLFQSTSVYVDSAREMLQQPHSMRFAVKAWQAELGLKALAKRLEQELGLDTALYIAADTNALIQLEKQCE